MQLEDHVGDIVAKARGSAGVSSVDAAAAAGLVLTAYETLEREGAIHGAVDWRRLGARLGLQGDRLARVGSGWLPQTRDLSRWRELRLVTTARGMAVNAYLIWDEVTREAALFDTGWDAAPVFALISGEGLDLRHVFITHGHGDHIAALPAVQERYPKARIHASAADAPVERRNRAGDFIHLGSLRITHRATPGHTEDGTTYVVGTWPEDAPNVAIVGDALFAGSMGKAGDCLELARQRVRDQIFTLPADTLVCPGHGPVTTVGEEIAHNPFFG